MYGTIARMRVKPGMAEAFYNWNMQHNVEDTSPGAMLVYQMDSNPDELYVVIAAENRAHYRAMSEAPGMHERYLEMIQFLVEEPEWHDGEVIGSEFNL